MTEKPLHVQVAEALGWLDITYFPGPGNHAGVWKGYPAGLEDGGWAPIPRYDTDWNATGPLIEKYGVWLHPCDCGEPKEHHWTANSELDAFESDGGDGKTPLIAVCNLILALKESGKLAA